MRGAEEHSADHLLLAGDLVDFADPRHLEEMREVMRGSAWWEPERLTILPGNHDLYRHSWSNLLRCVVGGFPGLRSTTAVFERTYGAFMGAPIADGVALPSLKRLGPNWHMLLLDTLIRTHRFDFLGSWRGWLDPALSDATLAALADVAPKNLVVASHHFPISASAAGKTRLAQGTSFFDGNFPELVKLLERLRPRPRTYLCGHIHHWDGLPDAYDTEAVADVPVYCQGRTGGVDGVDPSWTLHVLSDDGAIESQLVPL